MPSRLPHITWDWQTMFDFSNQLTNIMFYIKDVMFKAWHGRLNHRGQPLVSFRFPWHDHFQHPLFSSYSPGDLKNPLRIHACVKLCYFVRSREHYELQAKHSVNLIANLSGLVFITTCLSKLTVKVSREAHGRYFFKDFAKTLDQESTSTKCQSPKSGIQQCHYLVLAIILEALWL